MELFLTEVKSQKVIRNSLFYAFFQVVINTIEITIEYYKTINTRITYKLYLKNAFYNY